MGEVGLTTDGEFKNLEFGGRPRRDRNLVRAAGVEVDPLARLVAEDARAVVADEADPLAARAMEEVETELVRDGELVDLFLRFCVGDNRAAGRDCRGATP